MSNQCVVVGKKTLDPGSIDFGTCDVILDDKATVTLNSPGMLQITAGSLTLNPHAAIIGSGGWISVNVAGGIQLATNARIDVSAPEAVNAEIDLTAGGGVMLNGELVAKATVSTGSGGCVNVTAGHDAVRGDIVIADLITVKGGPQGGGGDVCITAYNGAITVDAPIDATGGEYDGGSIDLEADLDVVVNNTPGITLDVSGGSLSGSGGQITANSNVAGNVTINAPVVGGAGGSTTEGGGDGGELDSATNRGNVVVNAPVMMPGGSNGGGGGTVDLEPTGDLTVMQPLHLSGTGAGAVGGTVIFYVTGSVLLPSIDVSATSPTASGGSVSLNQPGIAGGAATVPAGIEINADSAPGTTSGGGSIQLVDETITVEGFVHANGGGGGINLQACSGTIQPAAQLQADGTGTNLLQTSGPLRVAGRLLAGANTLDYFDPANPPVTAGASITPAATIVQDNPVFPPLCPGQITTTTTSVPPSTTTVTSSTSTSSTTLVAPTTSSTAPMATTSSTTTSTSPPTSTTVATSRSTSTTTAIASTSSTMSSSTITTTSSAPTPSVTSTTLASACLLAQLPPQSLAGIQCALETVQQSLAETPQPNCASRCRCALEPSLAHVMQLIIDAETATTTKSCKRGLSAARRATTAFRNRVRSLARRQCIAPNSRALNLGPQTKELAARARALFKSQFCVRR